MLIDWNYDSYSNRVYRTKKSLFSVQEVIYWSYSNTSPSCHDHAWLICFSFWVLGGLGRLPRITPASYQPLSGLHYRSCRCNQSSPDCLTTLVVIRPTPVFSSLRVFPSSYPALFLQCSSPLSILRVLVSKPTTSDNSPTWKIPLLSHRVLCSPGFSSHSTY